MMHTDTSSHAAVQDWGTLWPQCVARAWQDTDFREALKRDPAGTLYAHYQFPVPTGIDLQVVESDAEPQAARSNVLRIVIPPVPAMDADAIALSDSARDSFTWPPCCLC